MRDFFHRLRHNLAHCLGWNTGMIDSAPDPANLEQFLVYFRCSTCGLITGITPVRYDRAESLSRDLPSNLP